MKSKSKFVEDWFVHELPTIGYMLTFNLTQKGLIAHKLDDTIYSFDLYENGELVEETYQEIEEFLPRLRKGFYLSAQNMEKNQCTFFFIPYRDRNLPMRKLVMEGSNK